VFVATFLVALAVVAGFATRRRIRTYRMQPPTRLTDEHIRQLEMHGWIEFEDPLDFSEIDDEETRFWEESSWEEPDEN
jgi:hypothetical protein